MGNEPMQNNPWIFLSNNSFFQKNTEKEEKEKIIPAASFFGGTQLDGLSFALVD